MLKNIERAYKQKVEIKKQWIVRPLIFLDIEKCKNSCLFTGA
jgi:hypothetical protein